MKLRKLDLFPTSIIQVQCEEFSTQEQLEMIESIDMLIENGLYGKPPLPTFQTYQILFNTDAPAIWQKLKKSFIKCCEIYLNSVESFCPNQSNVKFTSCAAWAFKKDSSNIEDNPWHNHNPAFLSGVFYLKVPNKNSGTEFMDPRNAPADGMRNAFIESPELSWSIFPGWLPHKSCIYDDNHDRYVVAANVYAAVKYTENQFFAKI